MMRMWLCMWGMAFFTLGGSAWGESTAEFKARVIWVMDGDSFVLHFPTEANALVARIIAESPRGWEVDPAETDEYVANLIGVDAAGWQGEGGDCYAVEAAQYLHDLIYGKQVTVRWDSGDKVGRRGRILVYVEHNGIDINAEVIRHGYAWVPRRFPADKKEAYLKLEQAARDEKKGLWGACSQGYLRHRSPE